jgi:hypothetical protein
LEKRSSKEVKSTNAVTKIILSSGKAHCARNYTGSMAMNFEMTEMQKMVQSATREFAAKEVRPSAQELDKKENPLDRIDWELIKKASRLGFRTLTFPEEYGGRR